MRLARLFAPDTPTLVGVRLADTITTLPYADVFGWLGMYAQAHRLPIHAWSVTPQGLLMLCTPPSIESVSAVVQAIGRHLGAILQLGSVFNHRYKTALIEPGRWVLPAVIWLEQAPVRLHLVENAFEWRWSSAQQHIGIPGRHAPWVSDHPDYWACGNTPFDRQARYKSILSEPLPLEHAQRIEAALHGQWALGDETFMATMNQIASRRASPAKRGRPRRAN